LIAHDEKGERLGFVSVRVREDVTGVERPTWPIWLSGRMLAG
jgi:hypothetical protein